jgi:tetratricopeptide (TPR) repeat protein
LAIDRNKVIAAAQKYIQKGAFKKAIKEYKRIVKEHPDDVRILLKIGDLEARDGQAAAAARTYNEVADHYVSQGFFLKAVAAYKLLLGVQPDNIEAKLRLADLYYQLGLLRDALSNYQQAAAVFNERAWVEQYLQTLNRIVEIDPENPSNRIKLGEELLRFENPTAAREHFLIAAGQLKRQGRFEDYTRVLERYIALAPDDAPRILDLARTYIQQDRPKRALVHIQPLLKATPKDVEVLDVLVRALGLVAKQSGKTTTTLEELARAFEEDGALEARDEIYKKILEIEPGHEGARAALGLASAPVARTQAAPAMEQPAAQPRQDGGRAPMSASTGHPTAGQSTTAPAASLGADDVARLLAESDVYLKYNLFEKALEHLVGVFAVEPDNVGALIRKKTALAGVGRSEEAADALVRLSTLVEPHDPPQALAYLEEAIQLSPGHADATARVATLTGASPVGAQAETHDAATPQASESEEASSGPAGGETGDGGEFQHLDALFETFEPEPSLPGHSVIPPRDSAGNSTVFHGAQDSPDVDVVALESDEILPADLDEGLEDVATLVESARVEDARDRLFELLGVWPQHAELLLRKMDELPESGPAESAEAEQQVDHDDGDLFIGAEDEIAEGSQTEASASPREQGSSAVFEVVVDMDEPIGDAPQVALDESQAPPEQTATSTPLPLVSDTPTPVQEPHATPVPSELDAFDDDIEIDDASGATMALDFEIVDPDELSAPGNSGFVTPVGVTAPIGRASDAVDVTFGPADRVLEVEPDSSLAEAIRQRRQGKGIEALLALQRGTPQSLEEQGRAEAAAFELAVANIEMGLYFEAITSLESLLSEAALEDGDALLVRYYLGIAYEAMDQASEAAANFNAVRNTDPHHYPDVALRLGRILA